MQQISEASLIYYARRQCSEQWRVFLTVLAEELSTQLEDHDRRQFMRGLGQRMAAKLPHPNLSTLAELESAINQLWEQMEWGYVRLREAEGFVAITHYCAPLRAAFGRASLPWTSALLEGTYAHWFEVFGAGGDLQLLQISMPRGSDDAIEFRLGRADVVTGQAPDAGAIKG